MIPLTEEEEKMHNKRKVRYHAKKDLLKIIKK